MGTLKSCEAPSKLLDLGIEHGFGKEILVSSKGPSFGGVSWLMFDCDSLF